MRVIDFRIDGHRKWATPFYYAWSKAAYLSPAMICGMAFDSWMSYPIAYALGFGGLVADYIWGQKKLVRAFDKIDGWFRAPHEMRKESIKISKLLRESFINAGLVNKDKQGKDQVITLPDVEIGKDQYNYYLQVHMLPGQTTEQWRNKSSIFSNSLGANLVKYELKNGIVKIVLQHTAMESQGVIYKKDDEHVIDLGYWSGGSLKWEFDSDPHMLIVGMTGTGKSTFLRNLFVQLQRGWHVSVVDGKFVEFTMLKEYGFNVASDQDQFKQVINDAWVEVDKRFKMLQEAQKNHYSQLGLQPYFLVIDEFIYVAESCGGKKKDKDELWTKLKDIAVRGRAAGVNMILILQRPDAEFLPTLVKDNVATKVVLGAASATAYEMAFGGEYRGLEPLSMGEGYCQIRDNMVNFTFADYELDKFLQDMQWSRRGSSTERPAVAGGSAEGTA